MQRVIEIASDGIYLSLYRGFLKLNKQRYEANKFRNQLLDIGFEMSQFSNYLRFCNGKE